jgi:surface carbohydrate biosynthesis protein
MKKNNYTLLIPVENQVRELDAKLLLACVAAKRGFTSIIGPRREMHFQIPRFPQSIYLSKGVSTGSKSVFKRLRRLGHQIAAWDEEALVHLPQELYYQRRMSPVAIQCVANLFAWGEDNAELWRQYHDMPAETAVHITGNPRGDLLRPDIRSYYAPDVKRLQRIYGDFILINTNFAAVNAYYSDLNIITKNLNSGNSTTMGRRAQRWGVSSEYAHAFSRHKQAIFEDFQRLIPAIEIEFPQHSIVVRPHPVENPQVYHKIAAECRRVQVINDGNVVPWLMAAKALLHNGCTTGVEAYLLDRPAITYRASVNEDYDQAFHHLPNLMSHQCFSYEELRQTLGKILAGELGTAGGNERRTLMAHYLAAQEGPLACERMVNVLEAMSAKGSDSRTVTLKERLQGRIWANKRRLRKRLRGIGSGSSQNRPEFLRHRYPPISADEIRDRITRFQRVQGAEFRVSVEPMYRLFFRLRPNSNGRQG